MRYRVPVHTVLLPLFVAWAPAQVGVRLAKVPDLVRLPAAAGSNLLLEVECSAAPESIWLAIDAQSRDMVPLQPVGNLRFQLNLADPRVAAMLPSGRDQGELFVFSKVGAVVGKSSAIGWSRTTDGEAPVRCLLRKRGGSTATLAPDQRAWLDPHALESLELQGAGARQSAAVARLGELEIPLVHRRDQGLWVFANEKSLRERLLASTTLEVEFRRGTQSALFAFDLVPERLELPDGSATFVVPQRGAASVPGSRNWLVVHIDDITMGRVLLSVFTADGVCVVTQRLVHERDFVEVTLAGERYVVVIDKLVNLLVGDDHAELTVRPAAGFQADRIGLLLRAIAASKDTFLREGEQHSGAAAMQFLLAKLGGPEGRKVTLDQFVDKLASTSSKTGQPYHVRSADGTTVTMQEWLRRELSRIDGPTKSPDK